MPPTVLIGVLNSVLWNPARLLISSFTTATTIANLLTSLVLNTRGRFTLQGSWHLVELQRVDAKYRCPKKPFDAPAHVIYYSLNTGKEVIQKYMSSNHSEVAAA